MAKARGCYSWDIDGNRFIDLVSALASITLGYRNSTVDREVRKQLKKGTIFSLPGKLEFEVAEKIVDLVPSAEQVRFGKNGTDATSAAVRLARAYTGREIVAVCGYHGWQDWFIGSTTRFKGVPTQVSNLTRTFAFNNVNSLEEIFAIYPNKVAAVILEPVNSNLPTDEFLRSIRKLCTENGAVLVFDETITGFRLSRGGAQEIYGVTPDLTTLGKGIANGYPLSAVVGRKEIMQEMNEIFYSGTFGGELLSLAAANVVLELHQKDWIVPKLTFAGQYLSDLTQRILEDFNLTDILTLSGHPTWKFLNWHDHETATATEIKTYFMQECFKEGVLVLGTHNVTIKHSTKALQEIENAYSKIFSKIQKGLLNENLKSFLEVPPLTPLFKVR
jgi:glutamate-1-semialdehyde 2,1-aminomutase